MVIPYIVGKRTACIKTYIDKEIPCPHCHQYSLEVKIYRPYAHVMFVPFMPDGEKTAEIRCKNCGQPYNMYVTQQAYAARARTPLRLYTALLLICTGLFLFFGYLYYRDKKRDGYVAAPMVGDVYTLEQREGNARQYFFMKVAALSSDTVYLYHTNYSYPKYEDALIDDDYFVKDDVIPYTRAAVKELRANGTLVSVQREYEAAQHYDRER